MPKKIQSPKSDTKAHSTEPQEPDPAQWQPMGKMALPLTPPVSRSMDLPALWLSQTVLTPNPDHWIIRKTVLSQIQPQPSLPQVSNYIET